MGGAVVIEDNLFKGRFGCAGALGPMITGRSEDGVPLPALDFASTAPIDKPPSQLGAKLIGQAPSQSFRKLLETYDNSNIADIDSWLQTASRHLALLTIN